MFEDPMKPNNPHKTVKKACLVLDDFEALPDLIALARSATRLHTIGA